MSNLQFNREFVIHVGDDAITSRHRMQMVKLVLALDGPLLYSTASDGELVEADGPLVVAADHAHRLGSRGRFVALFANPQSRVGSALVRMTSDVSMIDGKPGERIQQFAQQFVDGLSPADVSDASRELRGLLGQPDAPSFDPRILEAKRAVVSARELPSLDELAERVCLSRSRLSHLFRQETGATLRKFMLWEKVVRAIEHLREGRSITEAAHAASFADHAHLTRSMRKLVGQPPSYLNGAL